MAKAPPAKKKATSKSKQVLANASKGDPNELKTPIAINFATGTARKATKAEIAEHKASRVVLKPAVNPRAAATDKAIKAELAANAGRKRRVDPKAKVSPKGKGKRGYDWDAIERDYRTDKFTFDELSDKHGPSRETICRKAKEMGWKKDLSDAIRQATRIVVAEAASQKAQQEVTETIAVAAEMNKRVILGHRKDIIEFRETVFDELKELRGLPDFKGMVNEVLQDVRTAMDDKRTANETDEQREKRLDRLMDEQRKLRGIVGEAADVHQRITSTHKLVDALLKLQGGERKAHDLDKDDGKGGSGSYESMLDKALEPA